MRAYNFRWGCGGDASSTEVSPRSAIGSPPPGWHSPRFSLWMVSPMAVASCTSPTDMSLGPSPAFSWASCRAPIHYIGYSDGSVDATVAQVVMAQPV